MKGGARETSRDGHHQDVADTRARYEAYKAARLADLDEDHGQPNGIFANWQTLVTTPVPTT